MTGENWHGQITGDCIPVQAEGVVDGLPWYYRNRDGDESFNIAAKPGGDANAARWEHKGGAVFRQWNCNDAGWFFEDDQEEPSVGDDGKWSVETDALYAETERRVAAYIESWRKYRAALPSEPLPQ